MTSFLIRDILGPSAADDNRSCPRREAESAGAARWEAERGAEVEAETGAGGRRPGTDVAHDHKQRKRIL